MSRILARAATAAACVAIVLLVVLLVIIWTGVRSGSISGELKHPEIRNKTFDNQEHGSYNEPERHQATDIVSGTSVMFDRLPHRFDMKTKNPWESDNSTNDVGSQSAKDIEGRGMVAPNFGKDSSNVETVEHISPKKIHQNIYEDPADSVTATRHHTGHFRHSTAEVWDPHPQYEFKAFGKDFHILLSQDSSFVLPDIKVTHVENNSSRREHPGHQLGCFYTGSVKGDPKSVVSVSLCHGMSGHIRTSSGNYFIEPADRQIPGQGAADKPVLHVIYRASATRSNTNNVNLPDDKTRDNNCVLIDTIDDEAPALLTDDISGSMIDVGEHSRVKRSVDRKTSIDQSIEDYDEDELFRRDNIRQFVRHNERTQFLRRHERPNSRYFPTERRNHLAQRLQRESEFEDSFETWRPRRALPQEYFIEIMIVADAKMAEYHGDGLFNYILTLMSIVSRLYKDPSIGNAISIAVVKIVTATETFGYKYGDNTGIAANEMLKQFCLWQKHSNPDQDSPEHHDAALLLTRENLCHNTEEKRCDTLGLAELGRMCVPRASCAIVQDNGLAAAFTIAHEIGHVLSMPHDDDLKCRQFVGDTPIHNVMSRMLDDNTFPWAWSNCSRHYVTEFLDSGYGNCLLDQPDARVDNSQSIRLPGEAYSDNKQCELVFGSGSKICPYMVSDVCRRLWCTAPVWDQEQQCHTQHMPWADGTACSHGKWCQRGACVYRKNLKPVDGQWGPWTEYGECSRTCGGGIKKKHRECNNPQPQHGGNYCVGTRVKYRSCGTKDCPSDAQDFREEQCSKFNNNNMNIRNLRRDVEWHAKYTRIQPHDRCKLYCQVDSGQYYMLRDKVIDGTPCSLETFDICVSGLCKTAGCDHVLNSTAQLDACGVCRGDNSTCQRITGSFNETMYGYNRITKIPAGSSYIDIKQHGWRGMSNDSHYLALRDGEGGEYLLNGNSMISHSRTFRTPRFALDYTGPEIVVEHLNGSRPIQTDLILEVLSVGNLTPPQVYYEYTVPNNILTRYTWVLSDWSGCNRVCHGTKSRIAECRSTEHKDVVSDDYCRAQEKPREESQICNTHCNLRWNIISKSECSSHCGPGTRTVTSQCIYQYSTGARAISEHACKHLDRPAERETCTGPCEESHWQYGEWGACSATCKGGTQIRTATCVNSNGQPVFETKCNSQDKVLERFCAQEACPRWAVGDWTPCSVTCGTGRREKPYWCQVESRIVAEGYCSNSPPVSVETCDMGPCPSWQFGEWSSCSVSCGEGTARREVTCKIPNGAVSSDCSPLGKPPSTRTCIHPSCPVHATSSTPIKYNAHRDEYPRQHENEIDSNKIFPGSITFKPGYRWRTENFGECSKPCNIGFKTRVVKCSSAVTGNIVEDHYCDPNHKPPADIQCNRHACPRWNTGDWSQCDAECDSGFKYRQVHCQTERGEILPDKECPGSDKPHHAEKCQKVACVAGKPLPRRYRTHKWRMSKWSPCSKSCGEGTKTRRVDCIANTSIGEVTTVDERECLRLERRPKSQRSCQRMPCDLSWQEGTWSKCSADCGNGTQKRTVSCHRVNRFGWTDPTPVNDCKISEKPPMEQNCKLRECDDAYYWVAGPWKKCSAICGKKGRQVRRLFCHRRDGRKVARSFCPVKFRPQRRRKCNQRRCGLLSCLEAKKKYKTTKDNEYSLLIGGKSMSIYCHNMTGDHPLEYLTLPAGDRENFAEMYDKRLLNPNTCPYNGQRNENCNCVDDTGMTAGRTMFRRVRLDPRTLVIVVDDFTFSWTRGAKRIEFGKAGDCYSTKQCPQGQFSINLEGTQLRLSPDLSWVSQGPLASRVINKINQQKVVGKCGGYCGSCKLATGLKLDVLPP